MRKLIWLDMEIIKLSEVRSGEECLIHKVEVEDNAKHKRLCELGFCAGLKVYVMKKTKNMMLVGALGCCFSIDKTLAGKIFVYGEKGEWKLF